MVSASKPLIALILALICADSLVAQSPRPLRLSFAEAVRQATGSSPAVPPSVSIAGFRADAAAARVRQARSGLLPSLSLSGSWANRNFNSKAQGISFPGVPTIIDWKSGKAIYPEAFLQNIAYRHAADRLGMPSEQGLIVRLPKLLDDPAWEVMTVPETVVLADFLAAGNLWRWQRRMDGQPEGDRLALRPSGAHPTGPDWFATPGRVL